MFLLMMSLRPVLRYCQISSTGDSAMNLSRIDDDDSLVAAAVISLMLALDQRRIFLLTGGLVRVTYAVASRWSICENEVEAVFLMSIYVDYLV